MLKNRLKDYFRQLKDSSKKRLVALDIGQNSIRACELKLTAGVFSLSKFAMAPLSEEAFVDEQIQKPEELIEILRQVRVDLGLDEGVMCSIGISGLSTMIKRFTVPKGSQQEIEDNISWESEQFLSYNAEDAKFSHHILEAVDAHNLDVLVCAAKSSVIEGMQEVCKQAGFNPLLVELKPISLINLFEEVFIRSPEILEGVNLIIDFGAQTTKIILLNNMTPIIVREIGVGGNVLTEDIQSQLGLNFEEAENLKMSWMDLGAIPEEIQGPVDDHIFLMIEELKKVVNFYISSASGEERVQRCFVTGGNILLPQMYEKFQVLVGVEVENFDPFIRLNFDKNTISEENLDPIRQFGLTCMGLGLRFG